MNKEKYSNYFPTPHNVLEDYKFQSLSLSARILYIYLCKLKNKLGDSFYRSLETLSKDTGLNINSIKKAKKELMKGLYIDITRDYYIHSGFRSADRFKLNGYRKFDKK
jgi:hypothetical protein